MDTTRILQNAERDEARRTILREAVDRYNHELLDEEERLVLLERIKKQRTRLAILVGLLSAAPTVLAFFYVTSW